MNRNKFKIAYKPGTFEGMEITSKFHRRKRLNAKDRVQKTRARLAINYGDFKAYLEEQNDFIDDGSALKNFRQTSQND